MRTEAEKISQKNKILRMDELSKLKAEASKCELGHVVDYIRERCINDENIHMKLHMFAECKKGERILILTPMATEHWLIIYRDFVSCKAVNITANGSTVIQLD